MLSIDIDDGDTDDVNAAMRELRQSGSKVVCLLAFESDIMRILAAARQAIEDAGEKYSSFTWIIGSAGTEVGITFPALFFGHPFHLPL
jgi:hypothetical protein